MRTRLIISCLIVLVILIMLIMAPSSLFAKTFTDDLGRKVELSKPPERIISLAPSITETLFYLGLGDRVAGVTDFFYYPEEARKKPSVGLIISPNVEKIILLKPDLVFVTAEGNRPDIVETLERVHIKVYVFNPHRIEDIMQAIVSIGEIAGQGERAREQVSSLTRRIEAVKTKAEGSQRVRVLYLVSMEPMISVGPGSFIHDMIGISGGENVANRAAARYPRIEMEEIVHRDPEVIIAPSEIIDSVRSWKGRWSGISAVKNDRIYPIDMDIVSRPGPRIVEGLERIYGEIHGPDGGN